MRISRLAVVVAAIALAISAIPSASAGGRPLTADLSSANEVPPNGSGASGTAALTLNQGRGEICVDIETSGVTGTVVAGHIHNAPAGVNGPVVVNLGVTSAQFSACISDVDRDLVKAIAQDPASYYVNIHTTTNPPGEVRGQLAK